MNGNLDEYFVAGIALIAADVCRITRCGIDGKLCMCSAGTPANYLACTTSADCHVAGNTTALCDTTSHTCQGRTSTPAVFSNPTNTISCTPTACNAAAP